MAMMIKKSKTAVENAKREQAIKAAQTLKAYCADIKGSCKSCLFFDGLCPFQDVSPDGWDIPSAPVTREEMLAYVNAYGRTVYFARNGRTTAAMFNGKLYTVTRYYKDAENELVAKYELLKKIYG